MSDVVRTKKLSMVERSLKNNPSAIVVVNEHSTIGDLLDFYYLKKNGLIKDGQSFEVRMSENKTTDIKIKMPDGTIDENATAPKKSTMPVWLRLVFSGVVGLGLIIYCTIDLVRIGDVFSISAIVPWGGISIGIVNLAYFAYMIKK
jgi:hypothetical protein